MKQSKLIIFATLLALGISEGASAYPLDAEPETGIRRLAWQQDVNAGKARGRKMPPGAQWPTSAIKLRLKDYPNYDLTADTPKDPELQVQLVDLLRRGAWRNYHIAILDITDPANPRYAGVEETTEQTPGSVAKLLVAAGFLHEVAKRFPDDLESRRAYLRDTKLTSDYWASPDSHRVPVVGEKRTRHRRVRRGDDFSAYEWIDHALSPSSNAAATTVWREATLMRLLGDDYRAEPRSDKLFGQWDKGEFTEAVFATVDDPQRNAGLDPHDFRVRTFFTRRANRHIRSKSSRTSPLAILRWMVRVEQGRMIDEFSSMELKRMMYLTRRRVRYVYSKQLNDVGVYFKSGSFYQCRPEEGFTCGQYRGNRTNVLNALVEIEAPSETPGERRVVYLVGIMSNELKKNAALDHARLATEIHELILRHHGRGDD